MSVNLNEGLLIENKEKKKTEFELKVTLLEILFFFFKTGENRRNEKECSSKRLNLKLKT